MRAMRRIVCGLLAGLFLLCGMAPAMALGDNSTEVAAIAQQVSEMFPTIYQAPVPDDGSIYIGSEIPTYRISENGVVEVSDYTSYPLISNGLIIGIIDVVYGDGTVSQVILGKKYAAELQNALLTYSTQPFAIIHSGEGVYLKYFSSQNTICIMSHGDSEDAADLTIVNGELLQYYANDIEPIAPIYPVLTTRATYSKYLPVTNVSNTSVNCCGGLCWAASIAMMSNYFKGTSYNAVAIHTLFGCFGDDYHADEVSRLSALGMTTSGPCFSSSSPYPFSYTVLKNCIDVNVLLLLDFQDYDAAVAHNVVAYGYYANTTTQKYYFCYMDPNYGGLMCSFPDTAGSAVYVALDGYNYHVHCYITATAS